MAYMHAFKKNIKEKGTVFNPAAGFPSPATIEASLYEDSLEFGITWRF